MRNVQTERIGKFKCMLGGWSFSEWTAYAENFEFNCFQFHSKYCAEKKSSRNSEGGRFSKSVFVFLKFDEEKKMFYLENDSWKKTDVVLKTERKIWILWKLKILKKKTTFYICVYNEKKNIINNKKDNWRNRTLCSQIGDAPASADN